jgi:hypothetical protein
VGGKRHPLTSTIEWRGSAHGTLKNRDPRPLFSGPALRQLLLPDHLGHGHTFIGKITICSPSKCNLR